MPNVSVGSSLSLIESENLVLPVTFQVFLALEYLQQPVGLDYLSVIITALEDRIGLSK